MLMVIGGAAKLGQIIIMWTLFICRLVKCLIASKCEDVVLSKTNYYLQLALLEPTNKKITWVLL